MNLIPWRQKRNGESDVEIFAPMLRLRGEFDRLFDRMLGDVWGGESDWAAPDAARSPLMDVAETDDEILVKAEMPGIDPKEINVTVTGDVLTVRGEKREESEKKSGTVHRVERRFGSFERSIRLPAGVDSQSVTAECNNGILTVHLRKCEAAKPKKIEVKVTG